MRYRARAFLLLATACAILAGCRLFPPGRADLVAPPLPEAWAAGGTVSGWKLEADGFRAWLAPGCTAEFEVGTAEVLPVFLRAAVAGNPLPLRPLGSVWPHCLAGGTLAPSAAGGWAASVCAILAARDRRLAASVDWSRLEREVSSRLPDPWTLEPALVAARLADGAFRVTDLDAPELFPVALAGLPGLFVDESPAGASLAPDADGKAVAYLPPGVRRFLAPGLALTVSVDREGRATACLYVP
ncbi:MAG TPA: hypothetical protein PKW82_01530 [Spirochaetales bacterium]|nr:hypothetical protein [Spirochaetales bacterium]